MTAAKSPSSLLLNTLPPELHLHILTYLRAYDLAGLEQTCRYFHEPRHIDSVVRYFSTVVYPSSLTEGFETSPPLVGGGVGTGGVSSTSPNANAANSTSGRIAPTSTGTNSRGKKDGSASHPPTNTSSNLNGDVGDDANPSSPRLTYECLRNMEMLVLVRVLNMPEPSALSRRVSSSLPRLKVGGVEPESSYPDDGEEWEEEDRHHFFYVSKSWCKAALKWIEMQEETRREREEQRLKAQQQQRSHGGGNRKQHGNRQKKLSKKQQRLRDRRLSDASPPWPNVNHDLVCPHGDLRRCNSKGARAKRRVMDRQAWRVLNKLYPDSVQLHCHGSGGGANGGGDECLQCLLELETSKREVRVEKERRTEERKKPLADPLIRSVYVRGSRGVPQNRMVAAAGAERGALAPGGGGTCCPLLPGVYHAVPRAWCHRWRRYLKTGVEDRMACLPPDAAVLLCDAHKLPLVPPHLENYLCGETGTLLAVSSSLSGVTGSAESSSTASSEVAADPSLGRAVERACVSRASSDGLSGARLVSTNDPLGITEEFNGADEVTDAAVAASAVFGSGMDLQSEIENQRAALISLGVEEGGGGYPDCSSHRRPPLLEEPLSRQVRQQQQAPSGDATRVESLRSPSASSSSTAMSSSTRSLGEGTSAVASPVSLSPHHHQHTFFDQIYAGGSDRKNDVLDRENQVVVEIVTDEEFAALEETFWPEMHGSFTLKFAVTDSASAGRHHPLHNISWSTPPCRECDAGHGDASVVVRNRTNRIRNNRAWLKKSGR